MNRDVTQEMIAEKVGRVRWHGNYFSMICPFHDDREPSLLVYRDGSYCMGCRKNYTLKQLWYKLNRKSRILVEEIDNNVPRTIRWDKLPEPEELAEEAHSLLMDYPLQGHYLHQRGIESRTEINRLGWWSGYYTFPGYNENMDFSGLVIRAGEEVQKATGTRYLTPPEQPPFLYVTDWNRIARSQTVFVTFGIIDALVVASLGFASVSPSNGQTNNEDLFEPIRKKLVIIPDRNIEEQYTAQQLIARLGWRGQLLVLPYSDETKDPADFTKSQNLRDILASRLATF